MGRFVTTTTSATLTTCYQCPTHKYSYDANECWQNKLVLDRPGSYTFTVPSGVSCIRTVAVGGGGKPCFSDFYCNAAGAGGAYVEAVHTIASGCIVTTVVGRQQQDTTISYVCSGGATVTHTAGGAVGCNPGVGSTTSATACVFCSRGGCAGHGCNFNQAVGTCGSTCFCCGFSQCCGYCIVYRCNCITMTQEDYCNPYFSGGGSAGSFVHPCGGCGGTVKNKGLQGYTNNNTGGAVAGGGGGIGYINKECTVTAFCNCVCVNYQEGHTMQRCAPTVAGGGGGSRWAFCMTPCDRMLWNGLCENGMWRDGSGGWGAPDNQEGIGGIVYWVCHPCNSAGSSHWEHCCSIPPRYYPWHDIHSMTGSGSSGKAISFCGYCSYQSNKWIRGANFGGPPEDSGEGAGTGGSVYICCNGCDTDWPGMPGDQFAVNWDQLCQVGVAGKSAEVYFNTNMCRQLMPGVISYAGTLGGSGGIGTNGYASKAGFGGGGGWYKCFIHCVCWGGSYDNCNGSGPALAFPPCILDNLISNAGSGMAIIYWKDAS